MSPRAFYVPDGDGLLATELTRGPWSSDTQHAGPPCALLGRAVERTPGGDGLRVARITCEILRPIPIGRCEVHAEVVRPGRRVALVEARLADEDGPLIIARAWRIRTGAEVPAIGVDDRSPPPPPAEGTTEPFFDTGHDTGYHTAMEARFITGAFRTPGPATVWMRMRVPLVSGEDPSPLTRTLVAADSGNGVSAELDAAAHLFINTDLSVHLRRHPRGPWVALEARTRVEMDGIGLATSTIWDRHGAVGMGHQTLLVSPRPPQDS